MAPRKRSPQAETPAPEGVPVGGELSPVPAETVDAVADEPVAAPQRVAPPHPVRRYLVAPSAHLGTRVGGFVLTERGWVPAASAPQQNQE